MHTRRQFPQSIAMAFVGIALVSRPAAAANLIGQWTFNETAKDATGNGNDVVLVGDPSFVPLGQTNQGMSLDPAFGQYVDYGSSALFNITAAFTLESWFTLRNLPAGGGEPLIFGKDHTLFGTTYYSNGNSYSYVGGGALVVPVPLTLNQEHHLVQTWDGSVISVYRDGVLSGTFSSSAAPNSNSANSLLSGKPGPSDGTGFLDAIIDETRIYTGALSAAEVSANHSAGPTQIDPQWAAESGDWNTTSNWIGAIPNGVNTIANFKSSITAPGTVTIDAPVIVGMLLFDNASTYTLAGSSSLSLDASSAAAKVEVVSGSHNISLPMTFVSNCDITIADGSTLTIGTPAVIKSGKTVSKIGELRIDAALTLEAGSTMLLVSGATRLTGAPSVGANASIDLQDGELTIDANGASGTVDLVRQLLASGYHDGTWDGAGLITSSATSQLGLGWVVSPDQQSIAIRKAYYGDADLNQTVDSIDFSAFLGGYGKLGAAFWAEGDFNYDGKVNTIDFNQLAENFGAPAVTSSVGAVVPEPFIGGLGMFLLLGWTRKRNAV